LGIQEPLYVCGVVFDTKGKKAIDLQGLTFTIEPTEDGETTGESEGDTTGE
jgi:hypothetical protein